MLFRQFILIATLVALSGIGVLQIMSAANPRTSDFEVGRRLQEWKAHEDRQACKENQKLCIRLTDATDKV